MKTFLPILALITCLTASVCGYTQELEVNSKNGTKTIKVRPLRIGAKAGFPNLVGGNLEYVTPLLNNRLAVNFDYSKINSRWFETDDAYYYNGVEYIPQESDNLDYRYMEAGLNYYFFKPGKGLYAAVGYGMIKLEGFMEYTGDEGDLNNSGRGTVDQSHNSFNVKLGAKLGGLFYFRPEVGYSFNSMPKLVNLEVIYNDGSRESRTEEFNTDGSPVDLLFSGLIANLGIGFAF